MKGWFDMCKKITVISHVNGCKEKKKPFIKINMTTNKQTKPGDFILPSSECIIN